MRARTAAVVGVACVVLAGCATNTPDPAQPAGPDDGETTLTCLGTELTLDQLTAGRPASEVGEHGQAALQGTEVPSFDNLAEWVVLEETETEFAMIREYPQPRDDGFGDVRTHELITVSWIDAPNLDPSPTWHLSAATDCSLVVDLDGLTQATVTLDPDRLPDPGASELHLWVTEFACNSGEPATDRVRLLSLRETPRAVEVVIGVEPDDGAHTCPTNPPTPFTVELSEPLGERAVVDAGVFPAREIVEPTEGW